MTQAPPTRAHSGYPNPMIPGFNPDPSVVLVDGVYYVVTSTFEYMPGLPIYSSTDLGTWVHIGNVATRSAQLGLDDVPNGGGVYAPTIRFRDGVFYVIVTIAMSPKGCQVYTATDPAGPWSDGLMIEGIGGIDPDLAWDEDGQAYVTYSGFDMTVTQHLGILQARVDLDTGRALEEPRALWSGTGLKFPEAPHVHRHGNYWYLMIAEGGTERGHGVSVARGTSVTGPFAAHPANPVLSARSTSRPVQCTGHADLVRTPDGGSALVLLGTRPLGLGQSFSPLGRETFITEVDWVDDWPRPRPVELAPRTEVDVELFDFDDEDSLSDPGWMGVRSHPQDVGSLSAAPGRLTIVADGTTLADRKPRLVGRRQRHHRAKVATRVDASRGVGGLALRFDGRTYVSLEAAGAEGSTEVTATAVVSGLSQSWSVTLPSLEVALRIEMTPPPIAMSADALGGDRIRLLASGAGQDLLLTELDGRHWSSESVVSFTGRVLCLYAVAGEVGFLDYRYEGCENDVDFRPGETA